jgi:hypothetical protein
MKTALAWMVLFGGMLAYAIHQGYAEWSGLFGFFFGWNTYIFLTEALNVIARKEMEDRCE